MIRPLRSTTARLAVLLLATISVPALAMLGFMHLVSSRALGAEERSLVNETREELLTEYRTRGLDGLEQEIGERIELDPNGEFVLVLVGPDGKVRAGNLARLPPNLPGDGWLERNLQRSGGDDPEPVAFEVTTLRDGSRLLTGHFEQGAEQLQRANSRALLLAALVTLPLALGLTILLLRLVERRVSQIARIAGQVGSGELSHRVASDGSGDAFDRLSQALNRMLAQVEALVGELRLVTDGLAHDLRSPITRLQVALDRAAAASEPKATLAALGTARGEAASLQAMLTTALQISRAEAGIGRDRFEPVSPRALLEDVAEIYGPAAEEQGFTITVTAPDDRTAMLHRDLVGQALGNLVDNALRYAHGGQRIGLAASERHGEWVLEVSDDGPGIAPADRAEALRRFGRLDPSRNAAGSGLGLALATATARLHGGTVELDAAANGAVPGLVVRMRLPGARRSG